MTKIVEPNYQVVLIAPSSDIEPEREFNIIIPQIMMIEPLLKIVIARQKLEGTWVFSDERYPEDIVDHIAYPTLYHYHEYRGNGRGVLEFSLRLIE